MGNIRMHQIEKFGAWILVFLYACHSVDGAVGFSESLVTFMTPVFHVSGVPCDLLTILA